RAGGADRHGCGSLAAPLCRDAQILARAVSRASRRGAAAIRSALPADVGILSGMLRNGVSPGRHGRLPDPDGKAEGRYPPDPRLCRAGRSALACARGWVQTALATRRRIARAPQQALLRQVSTCGFPCDRWVQWVPGESRNLGFHCLPARLSKEAAVAQF